MAGQALGSATSQGTEARIREVSLWNLDEIRSEGSSALSIGPIRAAALLHNQGLQTQLPPTEPRGSLPSHAREHFFPFPTRTCSSEISALCPKTLREPLGYRFIFIFKFTPRATEPSINAAGNQSSAQQHLPGPLHQQETQTHKSLLFPQILSRSAQHFRACLIWRFYPELGSCLLLARAVFASLGTGWG